MKKHNKIKNLRNEIDNVKNQAMNNFFEKRKWSNAKRPKN